MRNNFYKVIPMPDWDNKILEWDGSSADNWPWISDRDCYIEFINTNTQGPAYFKINDTFYQTSVNSGSRAILKCLQPIKKGDQVSKWSSSTGSAQRRGAGGIIQYNTKY